jgi:hypothetical protein
VQMCFPRPRHPDCVLEANEINSPLFPRPPVFAKASTGTPVRPNGCSRDLPPKANSWQHPVLKKATADIRVARWFTTALYNNGHSVFAK